MNGLKNMLRKIRNGIINFIFNLPIFKIDDSKIVFDNFNGKGFGCNPKYIALELLKENIDCKMIWLVNDFSTEVPKQIKKVKYHSIRSYYELATAKIWIDNVRNYKGIKKKNNQFYIQTWHSSIGLKKCEADIENFLPERYIKEAKIDGKITDLMISDSKFITNLYKNSFWYDGEVAEIGIPRNDILNNVSLDIKSKVYNYFNIDSKKKIILYAPTFRKNMNINCIIFDFKRCCKIFKEKFNENFVMLIRLHPNVIKYANKIIYDEKQIFNATFYPDIQEIIAVSEIGITDYSSIAFDFALSNKPLFLLCKDYKEFLENERNLLFKMEELPFYLSLNEDELFNNINSFNIKDFTEKYEKFFNRDDIKLLKTSKASYDIVQIIKKRINVR